MSTIPSTLYDTYDMPIFQRATLVGMWLIPVGFCLKFGWTRFIIVWAIFSTITGFIVFKSTRKPLDGRTPRYASLDNSNLVLLYSQKQFIGEKSVKYNNQYFVIT